MSYSFVILDLSNQINLKEITSFLNDKIDDYEILYCSQTKIKKTKNVIQYLFDKNEDSEKVINFVVPKCKKNNIVIIRKFSNLTDLQLLLNNHKHDNQIIYFEKKTNKFKNFFSKIFKKIIRIIFSKTITPINHSLVLYGKNPSTVLKNLNYCSNAIRYNKWQGYEEKMLQGGSDYKLKYNIKKYCLKTLITFFAGIFVFASVFIFRYKTIRLVKIIQLFISCSLFILSLIFLMEWILKSKIGENQKQIATPKEI